jgi:5-methylthioribose kinase
MEALAGGVSSLIVRVDTPRGAVCVKKALAKLRVASDWHAPVERSLAEMAWLKLAGRIVPGAVPRVLGEDRDEMAFVMEFLDPARHPVWKNQLRDGIIEPTVARSVAERLARIHAATAVRPEMAGEFANQAQFHALRLEPYFAATALRHPDLHEPLHALIATTQTAGIALMHGDVSPKNILAGPDGPVFLDAECACWGDPAFDLAFCANHLLLKCVWRPQWTDRYRDSFQLLSLTYLDGVTWEPAAQLEKRACALIGGMLLARIDGRSPVEYITDDMNKNKVREFARAQLKAPDTTLVAIVERWCGVWRK